MTEREELKNLLLELVRETNRSDLDCGFAEEIYRAEGARRILRKIRDWVSIKEAQEEREK